MARCRDLLPMLSRRANGEADPEETLRVARHLSDCTACRITLARESRLAHMLDGLGDAIPVEDAFLADVMQAIPEGPPPAAARRRRRGLRLATLAIPVLVAGGLGARLAVSMAPARLLPELPRLGTGEGGTLVEAIASVAGLMWAVLDRAGTEILPAFTLPTVVPLAWTAAGTALAATLAILGLFAALARARLGN